VGRLWLFFRRFLRHRGALLGGFLCIPLAQLGDIAITLVIGDALDRLKQGSQADFLRGVFLIVVGLAALRGVFRFLQRWWIVCVSRYVETGLKQDLFDKLTGLSFSFHNASRSGDVVSRVTSDVENIRMFLGPGLMYTVGALVMVPVSLGLLFSLNATLTATMILPLVLMGVGMKLLVPRLHRLSTAVQESLADIGHRAQENFGGIRIVKGYGREEQQTERFDASSRENMENQIRLARVRGLTAMITHGAFELTFIVILVLGGLAMIDRTLPVGDLFKFIDLTFKVFWPIIAMGWIAGMYPRALASAERVDALLATPPEITDPPSPRPLPHPAGAIELEDVTFTYPGAPKPALSDVSVSVPAGGTLGVVGPTGSGKTTLLSLLGRLFDVVPDGASHNGAGPAGGVVRLDGIPVRELRLADLRGALGYVPQDSFLFTETWRENVGFGADEPLGDEALARLIDTACMREEIERFPDGVDQLIGERGVTLSGGQRQRTCIARALARDPRVLILDDSLSAVDTETEAELIGNLRRAGRGRTVVIAAHRLSSVAGADHIVVLDRSGRIADRGTHRELVARDGWYRRTWQRQQAQDELEEL
jgi:ATP-binding cassette, subfamily B, multidrug efflux pump